MKNIDFKNERIKNVMVEKTEKIINIFFLVLGSGLITTIVITFLYGLSSGLM